MKKTQSKTQSKTHSKTQLKTHSPRALFDITWLGASCRDLTTRQPIRVDPDPSGVWFRPVLGGGRSVFLETDAPPHAGAKLTARRPVPPGPLAHLTDSISAGGGALNQAAALMRTARQRQLQVQVGLVDSSRRCHEVALRCGDERISGIWLNRHNAPLNVIAPLEHDKLCVRSPLVFRRDGQELAPQRQAVRMVSQSRCIAVVSPKDAALTEKLFSIEGPSAKYLQPTGSLPIESLAALLQHATVVACNYDELRHLATQLFFDWPNAGSESGAQAPAVSVRAWDWLYGKRHLGRAVAAAVTLGAGGNVVVDFPSAMAYRHEIRLLPGAQPVPTRSGSGDWWLAHWILERELAGLSEPDASFRATCAVAGWLGLAAGNFRVHTSEMPLRQTARRQRFDAPHPAA
jgi:hypothetical protein